MSAVRSSFSKAGYVKWASGVQGRGVPEIVFYKQHLLPAVLMGVFLFVLIKAISSATQSKEQDPSNGWGA